MIQLSKENRGRLFSPAKPGPPDEIFNLPEKVLQFGTGVLLRGLCDYFISKANEEGFFGGRIVIVKSTSQGDGQAFSEQDNLYTLCVRGIESGKEVRENYVSSAISRVLSASDEWETILQCAASKSMRVVISNTTEVGIALVKEPIFTGPPASFPGKLLAFLYRRYEIFKGDPEAGMVIIPTELINNNGSQLHAVLKVLAIYHALDEKFINWLNHHNTFCNSLVDRIVAGKPDDEKYQQLQDELGYRDKLLAVCEVYRLWAIRGDDRVKRILSFCHADPGVIITPDIEPFRALKLHLLNGTHTLTCGLAYLYGLDLVKQGMADPNISQFVSAVMCEEIARAIPYSLGQQEINAFAMNVLDRFRNPYIEHLWLNITVQYSAKMKMRNVPVLLEYQKLFDKTPVYMATGFAAYLLFMRAVKKEGSKFYGKRGETLYPIQDDQAGYYYDTWKNSSGPAELVQQVLRNTTLWGTDLASIPGFEQEVAAKLKMMISGSVAETLRQL